MPRDIGNLADDVDGKMAIWEDGTLGSRGSTGKKGRWYRETGGGLIYVDDGAAWREMISRDHAALQRWRTLTHGGAGGTSWGAFNFGLAASGWTSLGASTFSNAMLQILRYDPADYDIPGKTTRLRVRFVIACNATAPGITFTMGAFTPTSPGGGSGVMAWASMAGLVTVASGVVSASTIAAYVSSEVDAPSSPTNMILGVQPSGTATGGHAANMSGVIRVRNVEP